MKKKYEILNYTYETLNWVLFKPSYYLNINTMLIIFIHGPMSR